MENEPAFKLTQERLEFEKTMQAMFGFNIGMFAIDTNDLEKYCESFIQESWIRFKQRKGLK